VGERKRRKETKNRSSSFETDDFAMNQEEVKDTSTGRQRKGCAEETHKHFHAEERRKERGSKNEIESTTDRNKKEDLQKRNFQCG
jgi:hypothetical protein